MKNAYLGVALYALLAAMLVLHTMAVRYVCRTDLRAAQVEKALRRVLDVDPPEVRFDVEYQRAVTAARITLGDWE